MLRQLTRRRVFQALGALGLGAGAGSTARARGAVGGRVVVLLENAFLAGMAYYDFKDGPKGLKPGDEVRLRREPDNKHDERAVEVLLPDGRKLGYVARLENEALSRLMDAGMPVRARLKEVGEDIYSVTMRIEMLA